jgi:hypothetical protein
VEEKFASKRLSETVDNAMKEIFILVSFVRANSLNTTTIVSSHRSVSSSSS